ncbi:MAG: 2Fe-2S iron-sulfur cluster-binding protein [Chloroflexota bacterium]|nr:(2Fe-2S)-binding protein [Chloroflexota bacterium]
MAVYIINGEQFEAQEGESIMEVGRRNGAHQGFICSGRGFCTYCECKVVEGAEYLNPVTGTEKARLSPERLESGSRLACRSAITGPNGTVSVVTRAEKIKRQFVGIFTAPTLERKNNNLLDLASSIVQVSVDGITILPFVLGGITSGKVKPKTLNPLNGLGSLVRDGQKVLSHQLGLDHPAEKK